MDITVREARHNDETDVVRLIHELAAKTDEFSAITENYVTKYLNSSISTILLAVRQKQIIGLLSYSIRLDLYHAANTCMIEELIVQESVRRLGVGSVLLKELLSRLTVFECVEISVTTMPDNAEAIDFYKKHGLVDEALFLEMHICK